MKLDKVLPLTGVLGSLPSRGVWIEMPLACSIAAAMSASLPSRGVWIEIPRFQASPSSDPVAPLAGSVD